MAGLRVIRVLHVLEAPGFGTGRHLVDVVSHSGAGIQHEVALPPPTVTRGDPPSSWTRDRLAKQGVTVHDVPMRRNPARLDNLLAIPRLRSIMRATRPDIVHGHASAGGALSRMAARSLGIATVFTPNGLLPDRPAMMAERALARFTDVIVAVSASEAELMRDNGFTPRHGIEVIPNGISLDGDEPRISDLRSALALGDETPVVGFVGRLARQKGPDIFIEAMRVLAGTHGHVHAVVVGSGPWALRVDRWVRKPELAGRLHRVPNLPDASAAVSKLDVLVQPSRWEGGPYVPLEAMRAGVPVVVTDVVGNRDTVVHDESGLIVPPENPAALARAVARLIDDPDLRKGMATRARARLAKLFDVEDMGAAHGRLYERVAGSEEWARPSSGE